MTRRCTLSASVPNALRFPRIRLCPRATPSVLPAGPFKGVRGHVEETSGNLIFVVTIQLIQRSFAIDVQAAISNWRGSRRSEAGHDVVQATELLKLMSSRPTHK